MKHLFLFITVILFSMHSYAQGESEITMTSQYSSENSEIKDILQFEGIAYLKLSFTGKELADKRYHLTVKEIWDGEIKSDSTIMNSAKIGIEQFEKINDTILTLKIISKLTTDSVLKMTFKFPRFSVTRRFAAINSADYSLRNVAQVNNTQIKYGEKFYLLATFCPMKKMVQNIGVLLRVVVRRLKHGAKNLE